MIKDPEHIRYEDGIVWTEDITNLDYVREYLEIAAGTRRRPVRWTGPGRRVGYSVLKADAPAGETPFRFARRVFWVNGHDRSEQPEGTYKTGTPSEGIDPRTVAPGVWGEVTERAWGAPPPSKGKRLAGRSRETKPNSPEAPSPLGLSSSEVKIGKSSLAGGSAAVAITPLRDGRVEIYIDCGSGTELGDGSHVISETLPEAEARARLTKIIETTPWLQLALALSVMDSWLARGTTT